MGAMKTLFLILIVTLTAGCATSVNTTEHQFLENQKTVYISNHYKGDEARFIDEIAAVLEKHGFEITRIDPHANYDLEWRYVGLNAEIGLRQGRDIIIHVKANRYVASASSASHEVADRAIKQFDEALDRMLNEEML